jgi:hypothetical protein
MGQPEGDEEYRNEAKIRAPGFLLLRAKKEYTSYLGLSRVFVK